MTAPSENASVNLNTTVYGNVVFNKKNTKQADPPFHVDKSIKMTKKKGTKINQGNFRIYKNVWLIAHKCLNIK